MFDTDRVLQSSARRDQDERYYHKAHSVMRGRFIEIDISRTPYRGKVRLDNGLVVGNVLIAQPRGGHKEIDTWLPRVQVTDKEGRVIEQGEWVYVYFVSDNPASPFAGPSEGSAYFEGEKVKHLQERRIRRVKTHIDGDRVVEDAIIEYTETEKGDITIDVTAKEQGRGNITLNLTGNGQYQGKLEANVSGAVEINVGGEVELSFDKSLLARVLERIVFENKDMRLGGEDANEQLVLGNVFQRLFNTFIQLFNSHLHVGNLGSATGPPMMPAQQLDGSELSDIARTKKC